MQLELHAFASEPARTARRCAELDAYLSANVLDGDRFICNSASACRASHNGAFYEAQAHHVGRHFDLSLHGRPTRIVVTGQEYGGPPAHTSRETRADMIVGWSGQRRRFFRDAAYTGRNPHMRGTTSLLRLLLAGGLGSDYEGEFIQVGTERVHVFECFALVNFLLCSAVAGEEKEWIEGVSKGGTRGRATPTMHRNCATHYRQALQILEPTIVVAQGKGVRRWMDPAIDDAKTIHPVLPIEMVRIGSISCFLLTFSHPASPNRDNWGMNANQPYLLNVVAPTVGRVLRSVRGELMR